MKFASRFAAAAIAVALVAGPASAAMPMASPESVGFSSERLKALDAALRAYVDQEKLAGISTLVARRGKVVHIDVYGLADKTKGEPLKQDTIFRMASMTKPIVGVAMMQLWEQGKWHMDDPVVKYIPEFKDMRVRDQSGALVPLTRPMTMRDLMSHTAGFNTNAGYESAKLSEGTSQDMINKIAALHLTAQPGEDWLYGPSVNLQGFILERITGMSLGEYLTQNIFQPLGMVDTGFYVPQSKLSRLTAVHSYGPDGKITTIPWAPAPTSKPVLESGSGGLFSTLEDYFHFAQMLGSKGEHNGKRILKADTIKLMYTNVLKDGVFVDLYGPNQEGVGFGMDFAIIMDPAVAKTPQGKDSFYWGGAYGTWFWVDPTNDLIFVGLIQNRNGSRVADGNPPVRATSLAPLYNALVDPSK